MCSVNLEAKYDVHLQGKDLWGDKFAWGNKVVWHYDSLQTRVNFTKINMDFPQVCLKSTISLEMLLRFLLKFHLWKNEKAF